MTEISVCSRSVLYDYAPQDKLELNKYYAVDDFPLKTLEDQEKVLAENMFYSGSIPLEDNRLLDAYFLNDGPYKAREELSAFSVNGTAIYYNQGLSWKGMSQFMWVRSLLYAIPEEVQDIIGSAATLKELNAQLVRLKATPDLALLLGSTTAWLLVTLARIRPHEEVNEHIFIKGIQYKLDGWDRDNGSFSRCVEAVDRTISGMGRGLANPTKKAAEQAVAAAPPVQEVTEQTDTIETQAQVEEIQPEQAEEIVEQVPDVTESPAEPEQVEEEVKKRTRTRKAPTAVTTASAKALDDVIAYLGSPVADSMTMEEIDEEIRKARDLGVVLARRMANLYAAGTLIPKRKLAAVRDAVN